MAGFDYQSVNWPRVFQRIREGPRGTMSQISQEIGIDKSQLSRLFRKAEQDPQFDPTEMRWGGHNQRFTNNEEQIMAQFLVDDLASDGLAMPEAQIRRICLDAWASKHPHTTRRDFFYASNGWLYNFKKRNHLSGRVSSRERKNDPDPQEIDSFIEEMRLVDAIFPAHRIYNSDESPVKVAPALSFTTQRIGRPTPAVRRMGSVKETVTAVATIRSNGEKLPLTIIAKGKTPVCVRNLNLPDNIARAFTVSGKMNEETAIDDIDRISQWSGGEPSALVWDSYGSHMTETVYDYSFRRKVRLVMVPKNATAICQPLDFGVFGEVSQRHQAMLRREDVLEMSPLEAKKRSIALYIKAWDKTLKTTVKKAWKCTKRSQHN